MRTAVVLFNLGGPDSLEAVGPFLRNLFSDPAIIGVPNPIRAVIARLIARRRAPAARTIYAELGGRSPLLELTLQQAEALERELTGDGEVRVFLAMRYWRPRAEATARDVLAFAPDQIVLLPLYPQYSTTTTASSFSEWHRAADAVGLKAPTTAICCYPTDAGLVAAQSALIRGALDEAGGAGLPRLLFSAHGLPQKVVDRGDPYQWQVERTAGAVAQALDRPGLDWVVCYQSRVGPLRWIRPSIDEEIRRAGRDRVPLVVVPIAFVSEHSETLVELDIEYRRLARTAGVPLYLRVPALGTAPHFIAGLGRLVREFRGRGGVHAAHGRQCPKTCGRCALA